MPEPKAKRKVSAKSLANLHPHPQNLKRGGKKPRAYLKPEELQFCQFIAEGATQTDAARWAGIENSPGQWAYEQKKRPLVQATIAEMTDKLKADALDAVVRRRDERDRLTHHEYCHRLRTLKTHEYRGDEAIVKLIEIGFKSTGAILPNRLTATANAGAVIQSDEGIVDIYKPLWLRESEAALIEDARKRALQRYPEPLQLEAAKQLSPERAKEYLLAAKGNKELAREAARKDGWQV